MPGISFPNTHKLSFCDVYVSRVRRSKRGIAMWGIAVTRPDKSLGLMSLGHIPRHLKVTAGVCRSYATIQQSVGPFLRS